METDRKALHVHRQHLLKVLYVLTAAHFALVTIIGDATESIFAAFESASHMLADYQGKKAAHLLPDLFNSPMPQMA